MEAAGSGHRIGKRDEVFAIGLGCSGGDVNACVRSLLCEDLLSTDDLSGALTRVEISGQWLHWRPANFGRRDVFLRL